jgi:3',5'-nucleoside bisphosphate phosphatase
MEPRVVFDLHSHSNQSDGILSPEALMSRAREAGVTALALTDHDTIAGLASARQAANVLGMTLIDGIEFSSQWRKTGVHILGLNIDVNCEELHTAIAAQQEARRERAVAIAARLEKLGIGGVLEGAGAIAGEAGISRPHIAQYLVERGAVPTVAAAFKKYLGAGKPGDIKHLWPEMEEVIGWIHAAGGVAVLAHPYKYQLTRTRMCAMIADFVAAGGDALEVISGHQEARVTADLARIASAHGLAASCGSDFHMPDQPWQALGRFCSLPDNCRPVLQLPGFAGA